MPATPANADGRKAGGGASDEQSNISGGSGKSKHCLDKCGCLVLQVSHDDHGGTLVSFIEALDVRRPDKVSAVLTLCA